MADPTATPTVPTPDAGAPAPLTATRDGQTVVLEGYRQPGTIAIDGDTVTQQIGRGQTIEYSLGALSARASDPGYFADTLRYAARHGDSVTISADKGTASVTDPTLEGKLAHDLPLREPILHAAVKHDLDPQLLAAVGLQETNLGRSPAYDQRTHRGDGGHGYGPFQLDDQRRNGAPGRPQAELDRAANDPYYAADRAAGMLAANLQAQNGDVRRALQQYNSGSPTHHGSPTDWGPHVGTLYYADSVLRHAGDVQAGAARDRAATQGAETR